MQESTEKKNVKQAAEVPSSYEAERRQKAQKLRDLGVDPFGQRTEGLTPLAAIKGSHRPDMGQDGGPFFKAAGRILLKRDMGKLSFLTLRDETGDLQVALDKKRLDDQSWEIRNLLDLGDQVVVEGNLGATKAGEVTIWAKKVGMASKSLLPPPAKWEGLSDVELRYRQRYVDLWANPDVLRVLKLRMQIVGEVRKYLAERGYAEVETPMMQPLAGGAAARPFETHHNALDIPLYLRIAPELYLKRLLVGGFTKVFELNRNFRNEGISPRHNPEFTMLEAYEAFGSWETMADLVEGMICTIVERIDGLPKNYDTAGIDEGLIAERAYEISRANRGRHPDENWHAATRELGMKIVHQDAEGKVRKTINLRRPWRRVSMAQLVEERTGWKFDKQLLSQQEKSTQDSVANAVFEQAYARRRKEQDIGVEQTSGFRTFEENAAKTSAQLAVQMFWERMVYLSPAEQLVEVYEKLIEPTLIDPTFVTHVPSVIIPLAKKWKQDEYFADVYELAINGQEISPGYTELNDPDVQAANFAHQVGDKDEQQKTDDDFLNALRYGMPPAGGMGLGVDRLVMMLTGAESIRDVILFPLMKP